MPSRTASTSCLFHILKHARNLPRKASIDMRNLFLLLLLLLWLLRHLLPWVEPRPELDVAALGLCVGVRLRSHRSRKDGHGAEQEQRQELQRNLQKRSREIEFLYASFTACKGILEMRNIFKRLRKKEKENNLSVDSYSPPTERQIYFPRHFRTIRAMHNANLPSLPSPLFCEFFFKVIAEIEKRPNIYPPPLCAQLTRPKIFPKQ